MELVDNRIADEGAWIEHASKLANQRAGITDLSSSYTHHNHPIQKLNEFNLSYGETHRVTVILLVRNL